MTAPYTTCRRILAEHSHSFALAGRLFPSRRRDQMAAVYAWCREADDAIDLALPAAQAAALAVLRAELASMYAGAPQQRAATICFQTVARECRIPESVPRALLAGLAMDVAGTRYETLTELRRYAFRVAGTVGIMCARVMGVTPVHGLVHAAHLGMAMQLTNICRDVREDWALGRLYVPAALLPPGVGAALGGPLPDAASAPLGRAIRVLLAEAERLYRSADRGLRYLDYRSRLGVRTARLVYGAIGREIARQGYDVAGPRAVVSGRKKMALALRAFAGTYRRPAEAR